MITELTESIVLGPWVWYPKHLPHQVIVGFFPRGRRVSSRLKDLLKESLVFDYNTRFRYRKIIQSVDLVADITTLPASKHADKL